MLIVPDLCVYPRPRFHDVYVMGVPICMYVSCLWSVLFWGYIFVCGAIGCLCVSLMSFLYEFYHIDERSYMLVFVSVYIHGGAKDPIIRTFQTA